MTNITIEQLETLAGEVEADDDAEKARLARFCRALARILAVRQPEVFRRQATSITDARDSDDSGPPEAEYHFEHAPRLVLVCAVDTANKRTSSGFDHDFEIYTTDRGVYVSPDGSFYGCNEHGTAHFGQYPARPGTSNRDIEREFARISPTLADLRAAAKVLRAKMAEFVG